MAAGGERGSACPGRSENLRRVRAYGEGGLHMIVVNIEGQALEKGGTSKGEQSETTKSKVLGRNG